MYCTVSYTGNGAAWIGGSVRSSQDYCEQVESQCQSQEIEPALSNAIVSLNQHDVDEGNASNSTVRHLRQTPVRHPAVEEASPEWTRLKITSANGHPSLLPDPRMTSARSHVSSKTRSGLIIAYAQFWHHYWWEE